MKAIILTLLAISSCLCEFDDLWNMWKKVHNKAYANDKEELTRKNIFLNTMSDIMSNNLLYDNNLNTHRLGLNQFSDLTFDEFKEKYLSQNPDTKRVESQSIRTEIQTAPSSVNWNTRGALTPVKNQGQCGSCWAHSAVESVESAYYLKTKKLLTLSVQQVNSCDKTMNGCGGGNYGPAWDYLKETGCIESAEAYPYVSGTTKKTGQCRFEKSKCVLQTSSLSYKNVKSKSTTSLVSAISSQPVSVAVAANSAWQSYMGGVLKLSNCPAGRLDHAVQATGYSADYWIVRNSWGAGWGEKGFIRLAKDSSNMNTCGILNQPAYAFFTNIPTPTPTPTTTTCSGFCGKYNSGDKCDCSETCKIYTNCCDDYSTVCVTPEPTTTTCSGFCGKYNSGDECDCSETCKTDETNCCDDYSTVCVTPEPTKGSCQGNCGKIFFVGDKMYDCMPECKKVNDCPPDYDLFC